MSVERNKNVFVRVKIEEDFRFVTVNTEENDVKSFLTLGLATFGIDVQDDIEIEMFDHYNTPIPTDYFISLVEQYAHSSSFYIRLNILRGKGSILLPKEIESYLVAKKGQYILSEYATTKQLSSKTVLAFCDILVTFIRERDPKMTKKTIENVCEAAIKVFPSLKWEPSQINGIDLLYDNSKRKGALYQKIVYSKAKERRVQLNEQPVLSQTELTMESNELNENQVEELTLFFKTCVVHNSMPELKAKLKETVNVRRKLISAKETRFPELFPFYFVDCNLILYDFEISFEAIPAHALLENWTKLKHAIIQSIFESMRDAQFLVDYEEDAAYFLILAKHLCSTKGFDSQNFLVFSGDVYQDPRSLKNSKIANPIILAIGESKAKISNYYIVVEQELITVTPDFTFIDLLDIFFKIHKLFNLNYFGNILHAMNFLEYFVYGMKSPDIKPTIKMINLSQHFLPSIQTGFPDMTINDS